MVGARGRLILGALLALGGVAAGAGARAGAVGASDPVTALAGRYSRHFHNGLIDGSEYWSDDIAEIVPVDARHAYVRFRLQFFNGHSCGLTGVAAAAGDTLVYREPPGEAMPGQPPCRLTIRRAGGTLAWSDEGGTCSAHCGARGSFLKGNLPWRSRRSIGYLARLKGSSQYRAAIAEWRRNR